MLTKDEVEEEVELRKLKAGEWASAPTLMRGVSRREAGELRNRAWFEWAMTHEG